MLTLLFWAALTPDFRSAQTGRYITFDYVNYYKPVADNLLAGRGLVLDNGMPAVLYPPGYPLLVAATVGAARLLRLPEEWGMAGFTLLCMACGSALIYRLARSVWEPGAALVASLAWATYPFVQWLAKEPRSEVPFVLFFYGAVLCVWLGIQQKEQAWGTYLLSGALIGMSMLIRPIAGGAGLLLALFTLVALRPRRLPLRLALAGMLLLGNVLVVVPWEVWAYSATGEVVPLNTGGVPSALDGLTFAVNKKDYRQDIAVPGDVREMMQRFEDRTPQIQTARQLADAVSAEISSHPATAVRFLAIKAARSFYASDSGRLETLSIGVQIPYLVILLLASYAAWRQRAEIKPLIALIWMLLLYFWVMSTLVLPILRYMAPTIGLLFVLLPALIGPLSRLAAHQASRMAAKGKPRSS